MAGVGVDVVGAEAGLEQLVGGVALPDRPLARAEHADAGRALGLERGLELLGHDVERLVPGDRRELAVLGVVAVAHPQQRRGQPVGAVHDLGEEVALDAVEAAVDLGLDVAVGGDHLAVLDRDHHAAAGAAEAARRLGPFQLGLVARHHDVGGLGRQGDAGHGGGGGGGLGLDDLATGELHGSASLSLVPAVRSGGRPARPTARRRPRGSLASRSTMPPELSVSSVTTILPASLAPWIVDAVERGQSRAHRRQRWPAGHGRAGSRCAAQPASGDAAAGDLDGGDRAGGDALAAAGAGGEVDLRLRHAAEPGAEPDRTLRAGVAAALADDAAPGEAAVARHGHAGLRARRRRLPPSRARRESVRCTAGHARHSAGAPGGPAMSWYIQIRKP